MTTGERIKKLRIEKGLSQEELGELIGVKKAAINKYETGLIVNLKRSTLEKLADALGTTPVYLLALEKKEPAAPKGSELSPAMREIVEIIDQLSPENQSKLLELSRLYLDAQRKNAEK